MINKIKFFFEVFIEIKEIDILICRENSEIYVCCKYLNIANSVSFDLLLTNNKIGYYEEKDQTFLLHTLRG